MEMESNQQNAYQSAYDLARSQLGEKDPNAISLNTDTQYDPGSHCLNVRYLGADYLADCTNGAVVRADGGAPVTTTVKVLILHYLLHAVKRPHLGKLISFREVRGGGANYYPTFHKRAILPLQKTFEKTPDKLILAAAGLDGKPQTYGDVSVTLPIFPLVPVTYVIWQADDEMSGSAAILFDENVNGFLPCEDIVLAASFGVYELMKVAKQLG